MRLPFRFRFLLLAGVVVLGLGWVATNGLAGNLVYYLTPSDLLKQTSHAGERVRLGGLVVPGSVHEVPGGVSFTVTDGTQKVTVTHQGGVPSQFQAGRGVVVEGYMGKDGVFHSDTLLVKHDNRYQPPEPGQTPPRSAHLG